MQCWSLASLEPMFTFTNKTHGHWVSWAHARLSRNENFQNIFWPKMNCDIYTHDEEERCEIYLAFKDHSHWWQISAMFFDTVEICEVGLHTAVTCLALNDVGKQHQTKQWAAKPNKWLWIEPRLHRNSIETTECKENHFYIFCSLNAVSKNITCP